MLIAEDLLLLLTDDTSGELSLFDAKVQVMLVGANLVELALMGRVDISPKSRGIWYLGIKPVDTIVVRDPSPTGDEDLDATLQFATRGRAKLSRVLKQLGLLRPLYERFVSNGIVRHERHRNPWNLALTRVDRWPIQDSRHKVEVRRRVIQALTEQTTPDTRSAALIALLHELGHEPVIVDPRFRRLWDPRRASARRRLIRRGEEIAKSNWAPEPVRHSIEAIIATTGREARLAGEGGGS